MAVYGPSGGSPLLGGRPVRRGVPGQAIMQALMSRFAGGVQDNAGMPQAGAQGFAGPALEGGPTQQTFNLDALRQAFQQQQAQAGGGVLIPLPHPVVNPGLGNKLPSGNQLRTGLLQLLHPSLRGVIGSVAAKRAINTSVPQNNVRIAIPATGAFHHTAAVAPSNSVDRATVLTQVRQQHVQAAQQQASQMANMLQKARARGIGAPRRATYAGY